MYSSVPFSLHFNIFRLLLFIISVASCAADNSAVLLQDLKKGNYTYFLQTDNAAYRSIKKMGRNSAYYVGLHLKRAGYGQAARFYFTIGEKLYEAPFSRLCRNELYETGELEDCLQSVETRLQELTKTNGEADRAEKEQLSALYGRLLLRAGAYDKIKTAPEALYFTGTVTPELTAAFLQFGKDMPPFLQKLAEGRIRVFEKRYPEAWALIQEAFGMEHTFTGLAFPALLSDIGKAGLYGADNAAAAAFFEDFAAQIRSSVSQKHIGREEERRFLFYTFFYAARCRNKIGGASQRELAAKLFLQAAEHADSAADLDSALWYYLDTLRMLGKTQYLQGLADTVSRWNNPSWYGDLIQSLRAQLTAAQDWKNLKLLYEVLVKTNLPEQQAAVAYTLARTGSLPADQTARLLQEAAGITHDSFYYRVLAAYRIGGGTLSAAAFQSLGIDPKKSQNTGQKPVRPLQQPDAALQKTADGFSVQEARVYIDGLLFFGLYGMLYQQIAAVYPSISTEEAARIAAVLEEEGRYADAIRIINVSLKNKEDSASSAQLKILYPRPWHNIVAKYAAEYRLPEYLLYALIRSESFFQPQAVSGAGAVGLTQLMPATAADIAKKLKITEYSLNDPEINIRFGAYYLAEMIRRSDNRIMPACFAYNAGLSRVRGWQKKARELADDLFLESLEYAETRDYGRKILSAAVVYGWLYYSEKPEDIVLLFFPNVQKR